MESSVGIHKLTTLFDRLAAEQRRIVDLAAAQSAVPPEGMLRHIADLESTLNAVSTLIEERQTENREG